MTTDRPTEHPLEYLLRRINRVLRAVQDECATGHPAEVNGGDVLDAIDALAEVRRITRETP